MRICRWRFPAWPTIGTIPRFLDYGRNAPEEDGHMDGLIYLIGLIVVIMAILSFFGLRE